MGGLPDHRPCCEQTRSQQRPCPKRKLRRSLACLEQFSRRPFGRLAHGGSSRYCAQGKPQDRDTTLRYGALARRLRQATRSDAVCHTPVPACGLTSRLPRSTIVVRNSESMSVGSHELVTCRHQAMECGLAAPRIVLSEGHANDYLCPSVGSGPPVGPALGAYHVAAALRARWSQVQEGRYSAVFAGRDWNGGPAASVELRCRPASLPRRFVARGSGRLLIVSRGTAGR